MRREEVPKITKGLKQAGYPLSFAQERLWVLGALDPSSTAYNIPVAYRWDGPLDMRVMRESVKRLVERHEALRTYFSVKDGEVEQVISEGCELEMPYVDLQSLATEEQEAEVRRLVTEDALYGFDLKKGPLFRMRVLGLGAERHIVLLNMHHIITDGWSLDIFSRELSLIYEVLSSGVETSRAAVPALPIRYVDFATWQRKWLTGEVLEAQLLYWKRQLQDIPPLLELPTDRPRPAAQSYQGDVVAFEIDTVLTKGLQEAARGAGVTPFMLLLAAFQVLLFRYTRQNDIVVGTPIANRTRSEMEGLIGVFINTLALRATFDEGLTFDGLLKQIKQTTLDAYANQDLPFEKLVDALNPRRTQSHPIFQVMFILQNAFSEEERSRLRLMQIEPEVVMSKFDLTVTLFSAGQGFHGTIEYSTDLFDRSSIERMAGHYVRLLEGVLENQHEQVLKLPLLTSPERRQLLVDWNSTAADYPREKCVHELFELQVAKTPDATAVVAESARLTYRQLNERADHLAAHLRYLGVGPDSLVGLCVEPSPEMIVAIFGILKAGGAYVPLDPDYPKQRINFIIDDAQLQTIITKSHLVSQLPEFHRTVVLLDKLESNPPSACTAAARKPTSKNLIYVIYTSGSTGQPKGVMIEHDSVSARMQWMQSICPLGPLERVLQRTSLSFDASVAELMWPLCFGAVVVVASAEIRRDVQRLVEHARDRRVTVMQLVPSLLSAVVTHTDIASCSALHTIFCGGEQLQSVLCKTLMRLLPSVRLHNVYGPTEATIDATYYSIPLKNEDVGRASVVPIGRPLSSVKIFIVGGCDEPVPIGVSGEILIGGAGLARGYLNRPALTEQKFVPDHLSEEPWARLYRTGDIGRYRSDGNIEFVGRIDSQVKLRGFRIELGEIEHEIRRIPGINEVAVVVQTRSDDDPYLVAYLTASGGRVDTAHVREVLRGTLPLYMVPSDFVRLDDLPRLPNGKLDRGVIATQRIERPSGVRKIAARTPVEEAVVEAYSEILNKDWVGIDDDFFDLGGNSLLATRVVSRLQAAFRATLAIRAIFDSPTPRGLAEVISRTSRWRERENGTNGMIERLPDADNYPLSFAQERLWFLSELEPTSTAYNIPLAYRWDGPLDEVVMRRSLEHLVHRHAVLRTRFASTAGKAAQIISDSCAVEVATTDLRALSASEQDREIQVSIRAEALHRFDMRKGPLFRVGLIRLGPDRYVVLFNMHHIVTDGWSLQIFANELSATYEALSSGKDISLPALPIRYVDFAVWQRKWLTGTVLETQLAYWKERLRDVPLRLALPTPKPRSATNGSKGAVVYFDIRKGSEIQLQHIARQAGVTLFMLLIAAFQMLLYRHTRQRDIVVGTPIANRSRSDIEGLIGIFTNTLALRTVLHDGLTFEDLLRQVKRATLDAYANQDVPFDKIVQTINPPRAANCHPVFQVLFSMQTEPEKMFDIPGVMCSPMDFVSESPKFDLTMTVVTARDKNRAMIEFDCSVFDRHTIDALASDYVEILNSVGRLAHDGWRRLVVTH